MRRGRDDNAELLEKIACDEPFVQRVNDQPFVTVPYTLHVNDLVSYELQGFSTQAFLQLLKDEFDVLYAEGQARRRMLVVACHDRVAGRPARAKALAEFLEYAGEIHQTGLRTVHA